MRIVENPNFDRAIRVLTQHAEMRVWSIIVTLFGDLARGQGEKICGSALSQITQNMGIKPAAMRVVLHRLGNDDWITSHKAGRMSYYCLTPRGLRESALASPPIYARTNPDWSNWHLLITPPKKPMTSAEMANIMGTRDFIKVRDDMFLSDRKPEAPGNSFFILEGIKIQVPDWLKVVLCEPELIRAYSELEHMLDTVGDLVQNVGPLTSLEIATLRTLVVHFWRRIVLRHPRMPGNFLTNDWRGEQCRNKVHAILDQLDRPSLSDIEMESRQRPTKVSQV